MRHRLIPRRFRLIPTPWWIAAFCFALCSGLVVTQTVGRATAEAAKYDSPTSVLVALHPIAAGTRLTDADYSLEQWPKSFVPHADLVVDAKGAIASVPILAGAPITKASINGGSLSTTVGQLRDGEQGVAIAVTPATPPTEIGDPVDVFATVEVEGRPQPTTRVAVNARVIAINESAVTLAVAYAQVPAVTFASMKGVASIVLTQSFTAQSNESIASAAR